MKMQTTLKRLVPVLLSMALVACGGGGGSAGTSSLGGGSGTGGSGAGSGSGSGSTSTAPSMTLALQDATGTPLATPFLTGTQNAIVAVRLLDANGAAVTTPTIVTVSGSGLVFTPASGQALTDQTTGVATVQVRPLDPLSSGATTLTAVAAVATGSTTASVQSTLAVGLGAVTASLSPITVSASTVPAYQTIQVSVPATLGSGSASPVPAVQFPVDFSASCGSFDPPTAIADANGVARSAYINQSGSTACSGTATLTAKAGTSTVTTTVTTQPPSPANIVFVSATPSRIFLSGSPGISQSLLTFKLVDSSNNAVQGQNVTLTLTLRPNGAYLGSNAGTITVQQPTKSDGTVQVAVNAGPQPGPVQVQATLDSNTAITNVSNGLAIASGLPVQRAFSLSVSTFNIEALTEDGVPTTLTLRIADRLGNPVPDGTTVNFVTEGGQVVASCNTSGASSNNAAQCSVVLTSQAPRPANGRLSVLAWAQGEENFTDAGTPTNNLYDAGESFEDLGQPFLDKNENGVYDPGTDVTVGTASGSAACPVGSGSVPNTCDGTWGRALVRAQTVVVFSGSDAFLSNVTPLATNGPNRCVMSFTLSDVNGNPMPAAATLGVSSATGGGAGGSAGVDVKFEGFGLDGDKVPNTSAAGGTNHSVLFSNCAVPSNVQFKLSVTTPKKTSTFFLP